MAKVHTDKEFDDLMAAAFEESVVPYIEAVASTIEGRADGRAWHDFELVTARAILLSYLLGLSQVIEDAEIAGADFFSDKATYAKSDCGAGKDDAPGFQSGNTCAGEGGDAWNSKQAVSEIAGGVLKTGVPVSVPYLRNLSSATKLHGKPNKESPYDRWYEPSGEYLTPMDSEPKPQEGFKTGTIQFENPIVLHVGEYGEDSSWKKSLSERYGGLVGKKLSQAIIDDGYDAIFTVNKYGPSEAVNLQTFDISKAKYASDCGANAEGGGGFQPGNTCSGDGDGKAEPGESRHKTSTPEFKAWFGDSKVVDDDGEPLVVYHGTKKSFDEFKPRPGMEEMYFFSVDPLFASNWIRGSGGFMREPSKEVRDKKKEMRTYESEIFNELGIENIDPSSEEGLKKYDEMSKEVERRMTSRYGFDSSIEFESMADIRVIPVHLSAQNPFDPRKHKDLISWKSKAMEEAANRGNWVAYEQEEVIQQIKGMGFDGIWLSESGSEGSSLDTIAVFKPTQIKSSISNTGSFDPDNPKVTHAKETYAKETYAKEDWPMEVGFEEFSAEPFQEAIDLFEDRIPMLAHNGPQIAAIARDQAAEIVMAERMGVVAKLDAQTNAISKSIGKGFWVTGIDDKDVLLDLKKVLAQSMRGVMPDDRITLPDFLSMDWLKKSSVLTANRLETIYRTNLQSAFNEGHMASMRSPEVKAVAPLTMIIEVDDPRSRDHHAAMDGYINTVEYIDRMQLTPPNGFNCRGTIVVVSWTRLENLGLVDDGGEIDWEALKRYNGDRQGYIDRGEYPDPGFI